MKKKSSLILLVSIFIVLLSGCIGKSTVKQIVVGKDNDGEEIIYNPLLEENISDENGLKYVNNEILAYIDSSDSEEALEKYLKSIDAKIVGQIPQINQYQIQLSGEKSLEEIQNIVSDMEHISWIKHVGVNYVIETVEEFYPNDKEWKKSWKNQVAGKNWGMEAIKAPEAWEYRDNMTPVNVGVFDTVFDTDHEDLKDVFVEEPLLNFSSKENKEGNQSHGTHVAGTIAANFNNEIGVCGVCPNARLYGVAYNSKHTNKYTTSQFFNVGFTYLITNNCKVINMSLTPTSRTCNFSASRGNEYANTIINEISDEMGYYLDIMIKEGYKFVICNSSGNINEANGGYHFYRKENFDDKKELSYYDDDDFKSYKEGKADETVKKYFDTYGESRAESGNVDAKYNSICAFKNKNVQDIIITVGAVEPNEKDKKGNIQNYRESAYSQGGEAVDVVAPGGSTSIEKDAIYSTVPGGYGYSQGTSMATPHVSGVAAMIFALDPDIEPSKVKEIIVETASGKYGNGEHKYGLVDANAAVQMAIGRKESVETEKNWKDAYIAYLENLSDDIKNNKKFSLVFVDDNDIPELYYNKGLGYPGGDCLVYYSNSQAIEKQFLSEGYNLSYIERKGKIRDNPAEMGVVSDIIYTLENGELIEKNRGRSCGNEGPQYDQNNNLIFDYHWNNQSVDEGTYESLLNEVYDTSIAKIFYEEEKLQSYSEILEIIRNYGLVKKEIGLKDGHYEYSNGQFLSIFELNGRGQACLWFWHNYGASSSDEDFFFDWIDGQYEYEIKGNRANKMFNLKFVPTENGVKISVVCTEGKYYSWEEATESEVWSDVEYTFYPDDNSTYNENQNNEFDTDDLSFICNLVKEHYNTILNTDVFIVFESECSKTSTGYDIVLRTTGGSEANALVGIVKVNTSTGEVKTDSLDVDNWYYK